MNTEQAVRVDTIVVPLDGSEFSTRALPVAVRVATRPRLGARIHLLSAVASEDDVSEREAALADISLADAPVEREVVVDLDPAGAVHQTVRRIGPATVCMASHGRGRSAALFGSVATEVVARGHDPVILVGQCLDDTRVGWGVLACIDETPQSASLFPVAVHWADLFHEKLTVITVAEPGPDPVGDKPVHRAFGPDGDVEAYLDAAVEPWRLAGHDVQTV
ncbi:MAG: universal stress protein, partial [Actinobacteria bacterium]|nr:universal stress protein [Actinomycetota bacterium]